MTQKSRRVRADPSKARALLRLSHVLFENGIRLKKAVAWMDAAIAEQPTPSHMVYRKGVSSWEKKPATRPEP